MAKMTVEGVELLMALKSVCDVVAKPKEGKNFSGLSVITKENRIKGFGETGFIDAPFVLNLENDIAIDPHLLLGILQKCKGNLIVSIKDNKMVIKSTNSSHKIKLLEDKIDSVPEIPKDDDFEIKIPEFDTKPLANLVQFTSTDAASRYSLGGVEFSHSNGELICCATDSKSVLVKFPKCDELQYKENKEYKYLLTGESVHLMSKLEVLHDVRFTEKRVSFVSNGAKYCIFTMTGSFPTWKEIVFGKPKEDMKDITFFTDELITALDSVLFVAGYDASSTVKISINSIDVQLSSFNPLDNITESSSYLISSYPYDDEVTISLNGKRLKAIADNFKDHEKMVMKFTHGEAPVHFESGENSKDKAVIMPMRTLNN